MEYFIHFKSHFSCVVNVENKQIGYIENQLDTLSIKTDNTQILVQIFPIENYCLHCISYSAILKFKNNKLITTCKNIKILNYGNNNYEVIFEPIKINTIKEKEIIFTQQLNKTTFAYVVNTGNFKLEVHCENSFFSFDLPEEIFDITIEDFEQNNNYFIFLKGKTIKNDNFLLVLCNFFCNLQIISNKISVSKTKIESIKYLNDIANQAIVQRFVIDLNGFKLEEEFLIFPAEHPNIEENKYLIPWAFIEAINYGNLKLAKQYLSQELLNILDDNHLKNFFGNYSQVEWNKYDNKPESLCFFYEPFEKAKIFNFEIRQNKITNIVELD